MYSIEINSLNKSYKKTTVLRSLNLTVENNIIMGLLGPNGHGKSTTINILAGVVRKDSGIVKINGKEIDYTDFDYKKSVGFVLEKSMLIDKLSAEEYLTFVAMMYNLDKDEIKGKTKELINFLDLENTQGKWIESFSAGMKKKISLAAAIIHKPKILILDEPFENIDPLSRKNIKDLLLDLKNKGTTILLTSHSLYEVENFCDKVAIINNGEVVYHSRTDEIRTNVKNEISKETYHSLEEIFIDLTAGDQLKTKKISW